MAQPARTRASARLMHHEAGCALPPPWTLVPAGARTSTSMQPSGCGVPSGCLRYGNLSSSRLNSSSAVVTSSRMPLRVFMWLPNIFSMLVAGPGPKPHHVRIDALSTANGARATTHTHARAQAHAWYNVGGSGLCSPGAAEKNRVCACCACACASHHPTGTPAHIRRQRSCRHRHDTRRRPACTGPALPSTRRCSRGAAR